MNQLSNQVKQIGRNQIRTDQKASISPVDQNFYCQSLGVHLDRKKPVHQYADCCITLSIWPTLSIWLPCPYDQPWGPWLYPFPWYPFPRPFPWVKDLDHLHNEHKLPKLFVLSDRRMELHENAEKMWNQEIQVTQCYKCHQLILSCHCVIFSPDTQYYSV